MDGILLSGVFDVSRGSQLASQSGEGNREWEGTQAMPGGEDTCLHITSLLTSSDPRAAEQLCLCFTWWSLGRMQQSSASSTLSPDKEEEMPSKVWARCMTNVAGTLTD